MCCKNQNGLCCLGKVLFSRAETFLVCWKRTSLFEVASWSLWFGNRESFPDSSIPFWTKLRRNLNIQVSLLKKDGTVSRQPQSSLNYLEFFHVSGLIDPVVFSSGVSNQFHLLRGDTLRLRFDSPQCQLSATKLCLNGSFSTSFVLLS